MKIQVRFLILLILLNVGVTLAYFQIESLRYLKDLEKERLQQDALTEAWQTLINEVLSSAPQSNTSSPLVLKVVRAENSRFPQIVERPAFIELSETTLIPPLPKIAFTKSTDQKLHFWIRQNSGISEQETDFYLGKALSNQTLKTWGDLMASTIRILSENELSAQPKRQQRMAAELVGFFKEPVAYLQISPKVTPLEENRSIGTANVKFLAVILMASTLAICLLNYFWFIFPLQRIVSAITTEDNFKLAPLKKKAGEVGQLAELVSRFFKQKRELQREISFRDVAEDNLHYRERQLKQLLAERDELNRDLHDEVIQMLFAVGLRIESTRAVISKFSDDKAKEISQCRSLVNEIIVKLRGYLEKSPKHRLNDRPLKEGLTYVVSRMNQLDHSNIELDIESGMEERLSQKETNECIAIVTEGVSNAIRHGHSKNIKIQIKTRGDDHVCLSIDDDGVGCNLEGIQPGKGLGNMKARADEINATFKAGESPAGGFQIRVLIPSNRL
ncbi:MAG: histidine kinase [Verrucomicrobiota bacterium]